MNTLPQLLSDLVAINSINPDLVSGAAGEAAVAAYIAAWLEKAGLEVQWDEAIAGRPNVIGIARGTGGGKTLLLNGHMDTVGVMGMTQPHQPYIQNGRLYGRGAYDMKGGVAACMLAVAAAKQEKLRGDVIFTAVVDEEYAGRGTQAIAQRYRAEGAIIAEPTEMQLVVAHKGFVWLEVETHGVAAHGSRPDLGVDAIAQMGRVLVEVENLAHALKTKPAHPRLGHGSLHASLIQGGQELSSYPERCVLSIERRTLPGETAETVQAEFEAVLEKLSRADTTFKAEARLGVARSPLETPEEAEIVRVVQQTAAQTLKQPCVLTDVPYWTDAATLWAAGIPTVLFGPTGAGAHAVEEWVDLESVQKCAEIYLAAARTFCG
ncbi:MAG: ArgE/DapE family deacylase [Anaerolineales bacterium]|nr:ArgE/DapE family deacylase [Anaerolineales bacterium]